LSVPREISVKDVGRILILGGSRDLDRFASGATECGQHVRHGVHVLPTAARRRVLVERAALGYLPSVPSAMPPSCTDVVPSLSA
jgi:hypothetical protein